MMVNPSGQSFVLLLCFVLFFSVENQRNWKKKKIIRKSKLRDESDVGELFACTQLTLANGGCLSWCLLSPVFSRCFPQSNWFLRTCCTWRSPFWPCSFLLRFPFQFSLSFYYFLFFLSFFLFPQVPVDVCDLLRQLITFVSAIFQIFPFILCRGFYFIFEW